MEGYRFDHLSPLIETVVEAECRGHFFATL